MVDSKLKKVELNPRTKEKDFSGAFGALLITLGLPLLIDALYLGCNAQGCPSQWSIQVLLSNAKSATWVSWEAFNAYMLWMVGLIALDQFLPGRKVQGTKLRNGEHLEYKFNGKLVANLLLATLGVRGVLTGWQLPELQFVYDHLFELANVTILCSFAISTVLYLWSFAPGKLLALGGNSGDVIYDWFIGRELNPRIGSLDIKIFLEMRPGLLLWIVINFAMAHHQYLRFGKVSDSMILVCLFQGWYVYEGTYYEEGVTTMMDTTTDGLGQMLVFGDISLVPFTYTMQSRYLADHPNELGYVKSALIVLVYLLGMAIFRLANNEKQKFKTNHPSTKHLKYLESESGSKLLYTGWWGVSRHINYFGDWLASWAYSLPCGSALIPYYFVVFFAALLVHREIRDEAKCAEKYQKTWQEYQRRVPYRIIPGIY